MSSHLIQEQALARTTATAPRYTAGQFANWPIEGLQEALVVRGGQVIPHFLCGFHDGARAHCPADPRAPARAPAGERARLRRRAARRQARGERAFLTLVGDLLHQADDDVLLLADGELPALRRTGGRLVVSTRSPWRAPEQIALLGLPAEIEDLGGVV